MFFIISSKTGDGINKMMDVITEHFWNEIKKEEEDRIKLEDTLVPVRYKTGCFISQTKWVKYKDKDSLKF